MIFTSLFSDRHIYWIKMGYPLDVKLVNGVSGDTALYVFFPRSGEAVLFDIGEIRKLSNREILRVKKVFVSHTHIDHFIGFDHFLRIHVAVGGELTFYGPPGIIKNVAGKLQGYLWNLLQPGHLTISVVEIAEDLSLSKAVLRSDDSFEECKIAEISFSPEDQRQSPAKKCVRLSTLDDGAYVEATLVDHRCSVASYSVQSPTLFHVDAEAVASLGLTPGAWIGKLKDNIAQNLGKEPIMIGEKSWLSQDLAPQILSVSSSRVLGFTTDCLFSLENIESLKSILMGVANFYCESCFRAEDKQRAFQKKHLTTKQAALIAASVKAKNLVTFHYSDIYNSDFSACTDEAQRYFSHYQGAENEIIHMIKDEISCF